MIDKINTVKTGNNGAHRSGRGFDYGSHHSLAVRVCVCVRAGHTMYPSMRTVPQTSSQDGVLLGSGAPMHRSVLGCRLPPGPDRPPLSLHRSHANSTWWSCLLQERSSSTYMLCAGVCVWEREKRVQPTFIVKRFFVINWQCIGPCGKFSRKLCTLHETPCRKRNGLQWRYENHAPVRNRYKY